VSDANRATTDIEEVQAWAAGLDALHARIAERFARAEPRQRVLAYLRGLLGNVGRKNGWQSAEHAGEATPDGMQRLLATADWDPDLVRDDLRTYVVEHLGDPQAVLVVDETGFLKKGTTSVGVQRQYSGTAGKVDNCQLGVFLAYASSRGRAFMDRELYLPKAWTEDQARCRAARVPEQVGFRTKAQLARILLERALEAGVPAAWVTADEVYGQDPALRGWLEGRRMAYVLAIKSSELLAVGDGPAKLSAAQLAASLAPEQWVACSAGYGAKGRRLYDCSRVDLRWAIENGFQQAKNEVGLDHYEVRRWPGWYRHITLALLRPRLPGRHPRQGHPQQQRKGGRGGLTGGLGLLPLTVPEVRRLLVALVWTAPVEPGLVLAWSRWRRRHQARARRAHYQRPERQVRLEYEARMMSRQACRSLDLVTTSAGKWCDP
jgi:SRSO17 transposase